MKPTENGDERLMDAVFGVIEPDQALTLRYGTRFWDLFKSRPDLAVKVLLDFQEKHPLEFGRADWVRGAIGLVAMGCGDYSEKLAEKWFRGYWTRVRSGKYQKKLLALKVLRKIEAPHYGHRIAAVGWIKKVLEKSPSISIEKAHRQFKADHPGACRCLAKAPWNELFIMAGHQRKQQASKIVLGALGRPYGISLRTLESWRARLRQDERKKH